MAITLDLSVLGGGTYTIEDDGTPGNGTSVVRDPFGAIIATFLHPADAVTVISRAGQNLNINITDSLTTANFTVGSLTTPAQNPDLIQIAGVLTSGTVTLAARDAVNEWGSDSATDIIAGTLLIDAGTGIGVGDAIETQVSVLEAESVTGGIRLSNINNLVIGGATANLRGLFTGTSGDVVLTNLGSVTLVDENGIESAHSAGNLTLTAIGAIADIQSTVDQDALFAVGNITLSAQRDVLFGTTGSDFDNDVRAGGAINITAGRDFHIDGFSDMASDDQGLGSNGGITITVGRDILIEDDNGSDASVGVTASASTGAVVLTTGFGGTLSLAADSSSAIQARSSGVVINADRILIENDSGINVSGGGTARLTGASAGRNILVGSAADGVTAMELSDAELDRVVAQNVIIGGPVAGALAVIGAITHPNSNLTLESGDSVAVQADVTTPVSLTLRAAGNVVQAAASIITTGTLNALVDTPDTDPSGGANSYNGALSIASSTVTGNADADTLTGTAIADLMNGGAQNDQLRGLGGNDTIFGGAGNDTSIHSGLRSAYTILTNGTTFQVNGPDGNDTLTDVEFASFSDISLFLQPGATGGDNSFTAPTGNSHINGLSGKDTVTFNFALVDATVTYSGNLIIIDSASSHTELTGIERFVFTDGTIDNNDGNALIDDLFYYSHNHDVWLAGVDAEIHFDEFGWEEGRDPNAFFDTEGYLAQYADVAAANVNPLVHYHIFGFKEGRDPSLQFDTAQYYAANPDVAAAQVDPLDHFLWFGQHEGRLPFADGVWG